MISFSPPAAFRSQPRFQGKWFKSDKFSTLITSAWVFQAVAFTIRNNVKMIACDEQCNRDAHGLGLNGKVKTLWLTRTRTSATFLCGSLIVFIFLPQTQVVPPPWQAFETSPPTPPSPGQFLNWRRKRKMLMRKILGNAKIYKFEHIEVLVARYKLYNPTLSSMTLR